MKCISELSFRLYQEQVYFVLSCLPPPLTFNNKKIPKTELLMVEILRHVLKFVQLRDRTTDILKHSFPVTKPDTKCIITFANQSGYISF
ncbi:hypothetical protein A4A49_04352, partial [Nicotiana attenuata]